ncbi:MAG: PDZ domain-containing protein [Phycisphaerae bacterium]
MVVTGLTKGGPAQKAGLQKYDVITEIDGLPANDEVLAAAKERAGVGNALSLTVIRRGQPTHIDVPVIAVSH